MLWFKTQYVRFLEEERSRLLAELVALKRDHNRLVERLLRKSGLEPSLESPLTAEPKALDKMLASADIFSDIEEIPQQDDIVDNRREKYDEFVS